MNTHPNPINHISTSFYHFCLISGHQRIKVGTPMWLPPIFFATAIIYFCRQDQTNMNITLLQNQHYEFMTTFGKPLLDIRLKS